MALLPWREVAQRAAALARPVSRIEQASLQGAAGRILASGVAALRPLPETDHAVMDGYALGAPPPGQYTLLNSRPAVLGHGEAIAVTTGETLPEGSSAVVLAARAMSMDGTLTVDTASVKDNIRRSGEEARPGMTILRSGIRLDARHLALARAAGVGILSVHARPRVALLGVSDSREPLPHIPVLEALLDSPALALSMAGTATTARLGGQIARLAHSHDCIVIIGESLGDETGPLSALGATTLLRAAMKPAKPIHLGHVGGTALVGLSGTAYAVAAAAHLFLRPLLAAMAGLSPDNPLQSGEACFDRSREPGRAEALPVRMAWRDGKLTLASAGRFGQLSALAGMDGFAIVEAGAGDIRTGDNLACHPLMMPLV